jgi:uncharacterized protein YndB with AHSA1/START domain
MTERRLEKRVELDATPEQVWAAIATGPGITAWFVPHRVEEREGGEVEGDFGGGQTATGRVTAWEPGRRFTYRADGAAHAFEFLVEARGGGGAVLRFVQSGFDGDGWEDEYDALDTGWELFFHNLRQYLAHFAGLPARGVVSLAWVADRPAAQLWPVLHRALGLAGHPAVGDEVVLAPEGVEPVRGVVDIATDAFLGVRSAHGLHRIGAEGDAGCGVSAYHYFYGVDVDAAALTAGWQGWLDGLFAAPVSEPAP